MIKEIIVVEGRHDESKIKSLFECDVIITNGSAISEETLTLLESLSRDRGLIVFTDPDSPGERIRKIIQERIPSSKHAFVSKKHCQGKRNVGIEYATNEAIIEALENVYEISPTSQTISWTDYTSLGIMTSPKTKQLREYISKELHLGYVNNKQLFKRLNMFGITLDTLTKLVNEWKKRQEEDGQ